MKNLKYMLVAMVSVALALPVVAQVDDGSGAVDQGGGQGLAAPAGGFGVGGATDQGGGFGGGGGGGGGGRRGGRGGGGAGGGGRRGRGGGGGFNGQNGPGGQGGFGPGGAGNYGAGGPGGYGAGGTTGFGTYPGGATDPTTGGRRGRTPNTGATSPRGGTRRTFGPVTQSLSGGDYAILDSTSIFARDRRAVDPTLQFDTPRKGAAPVFMGVIVENDGSPIAVLQNPGSQPSDYVKAGDTVRWDQSKVVSVSFDKMVVTGGAPEANGITPTGNREILVAHNLRNEDMTPQSTFVAYQSLDVLNQGNPGQTSQNGNTRRGRGGQNNLGFGIQSSPQQQALLQSVMPTNANVQMVIPGQGAGAFTQYGGYGGGGPGGGFGQAGAAPIVASNDPPLPPGSQDDLAARMAARRAQQLSGQ